MWIIRDQYDSLTQKIIYLYLALNLLTTLGNFIALILKGYRAIILTSFVLM
jgi:hypothetical protein